MGTKIEKRVSATPGDQFTIELEANPTTGYLWTTTFDPKRVRLLKQEYIPKGTQVGSGGVDRFIFKVLASGDSEISFDYKRAWEAEPIEKKVFHVSGR